MPCFVGRAKVKRFQTVMPIDIASSFKNGYTKHAKHEDSVENESVKDETESNQFLATDDLVRDLIEAVKKEEVLYKPGHKHFRHVSYSFKIDSLI